MFKIVRSISCAMGKKRARAKAAANEYAGWAPPPGAPPRGAVAALPRGVSPAAFWRDHISRRRPALVDGLPTDADFRAGAAWTDARLAAAAGGATVEVETRPKGGAFGRGRRARARFGDVLRRLAAGDDSLYLTTQPHAPAPDGHPELLAPPLARGLAADVPLRPALAGALVPQSINLWAGAAPSDGSGASSGLHHDFHDNLYVLLRGRKRFLLWPPSAAPVMGVAGRLARVHANGRIVYAEQGDVRADGADAGEAAAARARRGAEAALAAAEAAAAAGAPGAAERLAAAEAALEAVLEDALLGGGGVDDFDTMEEGGGGGGGGGAGSAGAAGEPPSFCAAAAAAPPPALACELRAGQMLYLPAGWFHEVTSFSDYASESGGAAKANGKANGGGEAPSSSRLHLALNYWFHPPDNADPSPAGFRRPYRDAYWPEVWTGRSARCEALRADGGEDGEVGEAPAGEEDVELVPIEAMPKHVRPHLMRAVHVALRGSFGWGRRHFLARLARVRVRRRRGADDGFLM